MENTDLYLAPYPKQLSLDGGVFNAANKHYIRLIAEDIQSLIAAAEQTGMDWEVTASPKVPEEQLGMVIQLDEMSGIPADGYHLTVSSDLIEILASTASGAFYGACTFAQIVKQSESIPCLSIEDWPDFPDRGVMLDISRDKVPTMETLYHLVDLFAEWKINQIQLYTEHTFAYLAHPIVWKDASPMTGAEILELDAYCKTKFIELVPNQNSFGHMERWLKHDEYRQMAESPYGGDTIWGYRGYPFSLSPTEDRCIPFIDGLYEELLPHFTSTLFNVGCDETIDLGFGKSKQICEERGTEQVYLDFLLEIYELTQKYGRTMMFWGDIINHHPKMIEKLPRDVIAMEWGYEADHPFKENTARFKESGIPFYVCPGTSAWGSLVGRTDNALENISSAATCGVESGAIGYLNTSWGDGGHWNPLSVEHLGYLAGAMVSWNAETDLKKTLARNLSIHAFGDMTGKTGQALYDLGNLYLLFAKLHNSSIIWQMILGEPNQDILAKINCSEFDQMDSKLNEIVEAFQGNRITVDDADIIQMEMQFLFDTLHFAAEVGRMKAGGSDIENLEDKIEKIRNEHRNVWLHRNRIGGLEDSANRLKAEWLTVKKAQD